MLKFSAHIGFLFSELPFVERITAAKSFGFDAVEHPAPFDTAASVVAHLLRESNLTYVQTGFPAGDARRGEKGLAAFPQRRGEFRASVSPTLEYASEIGCKMVHAMAGVVVPDLSEAAMWDEYLENVAFSADAARAYGIDIIIEPIGPGSVANYLVHEPRAAVEAIVSLDRENVRLLFDVYHAISMNVEPLEFMARHENLIGHVQIADYPGRHEPGSAIVDFAKIFDRLETIGYTGHVGCEYHPSGQTSESFAWLSKARDGGL
ncbi:TIM barrel protein [Rhizobium leguminosarum bv. viciae]|nr:TIM barrel protein [Rhizobium leguminosarum bv. viciae]